MKLKNGNDKIKGRALGRMDFGSRGKNLVVKIFLYALLIGVTYVFLFPFLYMVVTACKTNADLNDVTVNWIPNSIKIDNFRMALEALNYGTGLKNTFLQTFLPTIGHLLSCGMAGYALARYKFKGQKFVFLLVIVSIIIPLQTLIIPSYILYSKVGMLNSIWPIVLPCFFGIGLKGGLFVFIFRQFFLGLPKEIEEAAKIDGCSFLGTYFRVVMPMSKSSLLVVSVLSAVWHWNSSYEAGIYISKEGYKPLASRISVIVDYVNNPPDSFFERLSSASSEQVINVAVLMAGCLLILLPLIIGFAVVQRYFMQGMERSGLGGD